MNNNTFKKIISWLLVIIWMITIFYFSNMNDIKSNEKSKNTINYIIETTEKLENNNIKKSNNKEILIEYLNYPIRKCAHIIIYLILSLLLLNALTKTNIKNKYFLTILICFLYALTDEYHQTFISGRTGQFLDVLIDTAGSFLGLIIYNKLATKTNKKRQS